MRPNSDYLDRIIVESTENPVKVLDHGFIRVVDYCGNETSVIKAARQSYAAEPTPRKASEDRNLLRYLMRHRHTTPLEMCELSVQVKLPIFAARQWIRHRTANVNELSGRYTELPREFYIPDLEQIKAQSTNNKQGRGANIELTEASNIRDLMVADANISFDNYDVLLNVYDLARELARINLPLSTYTTWTWKVDLHNLLHFLSLRLDSHAQYEIRVYADIIWNWVQGWVPNIAEAFNDYRLEAVSFSKQEKEILQQMLSVHVNENWNKFDTSCLGTRECAEFKAKLNAMMVRLIDS